MRGWEIHPNHVWGDATTRKPTVEGRGPFGAMCRRDITGLELIKAGVAPGSGIRRPIEEGRRSPFTAL